MEKYFKMWLAIIAIGIHHNRHSVKVGNYMAHGILQDFWKNMKGHTDICKENFYL